MKNSKNGIIVLLTIFVVSSAFMTINMARKNKAEQAPANEVVTTTSQSETEDEPEAEQIEKEEMAELDVMPEQPEEVEASEGSDVSEKPEALEADASKESEASEKPEASEESDEKESEMIPITLEAEQGSTELFMETLPFEGFEGEADTSF